MDGAVGWIKKGWLGPEINAEGEKWLLSRGGWDSTSSCRWSWPGHWVVWGILFALSPQPLQDLLASPEASVAQSSLPAQFQPQMSHLPRAPEARGQHALLLGAC